VERFSMNALQNRFRPQLERLDERIVPAHGGLGQANFGNLISALNNIAVQVQEVNVLNNVDEIRVVYLEDVLNNSLNNLRALNNVLRNADIDVNVLSGLQDVLSHNEVLNNNNILNNALDQNKVAISDVIAVNVLSGGDLIVFADNPADPITPVIPG